MLDDVGEGNSQQQKSELLNEPLFQIGELRSKVDELKKQNSKLNISVNFQTISIKY